MAGEAGNAAGMFGRARRLAVIVFAVAHGWLFASACRPALADSAPAACPSVPDLPADLEAAFAFDIRSPQVIHFTSALAALPPTEQKRVVAAALGAAETAPERDAEAAVAATCPTLDGFYGDIRAMFTIANRWQVPVLADPKRFGDISRVVDTAVEALAAGDGIPAAARRQALLPFGDGVRDEPPAVPAQAAGCAEPDVPANVIEAVQAHDPPLADVAATRGTVVVKVSLTETGDVRTATLYRETLGDRTGAGDLIRASILAAATSTYAPQISKCRPVAGAYLFRIDYTRA